MIDIDKMDLRELQKEAAKALSSYKATNNFIHQFNKQAHHDSQNWYKAVIKHYVSEYGNLPSQTGPAKDIKLVME